MSDPVRWWRVGVPLGAATILAMFALLYRESPQTYLALLTAWGVAPFRFPFLDTHAVLSALQCTAQGFDTYQANPCDVLTRAFTYSPLILDAAIFPVSTAWNNWVGLALAVAFLIAVASLPAPRGRREWTIVLLALLSTMTAFALERGNIDVPIFVLIVIAARLSSGRPGARGVAYALFVVASLLKYYPTVAMVAALRERPGRLAAIVGLTGAALLLFVTHYWHGLQEAMERVPSGSYFTDFFGAGNLPRGLMVLLSPLATQWPATAALWAFLPNILLVLLIYYAARSALATARDVTAMPRDREGLLLAVGTAIIVGCFFAGQSIDYRGIFFLLLLPGLLVLAREPGGRSFRATAAMIVFLMWGEMFREALQHVQFQNAGVAGAWQALKAGFWMVREIVWWRVIGTLVGLLLSFIADTETARWVLAERRTVRRVRQ